MRVARQEIEKKWQEEDEEEIEKEKVEQEKERVEKLEELARREKEQEEARVARQEEGEEFVVMTTDEKTEKLMKVLKKVADEEEKKKEEKWWAVKVATKKKEKEDEKEWVLMMTREVAEKMIKTAVTVVNEEDKIKEDDGDESSRKESSGGKRRHSAPPKLGVVRPSGPSRLFYDRLPRHVSADMFEKVNVAWEEFDTEVASSVIKSSKMGTEAEKAVKEMAKTMPMGSLNAMYASDWAEAAAPKVDSLIRRMMGMSQETISEVEAWEKETFKMESSLTLDEKLATIDPSLKLAVRSLAARAVDETSPLVVTVRAQANSVAERLPDSVVKKFWAVVWSMADVVARATRNLLLSNAPYHRPKLLHHRIRQPLRHRIRLRPHRHHQRRCFIHRPGGERPHRQLQTRIYCRQLLIQRQTRFHLKRFLLPRLHLRYRLLRHTHHPPYQTIHLRRRRLRPVARIHRIQTPHRHRLRHLLYSFLRLRPHLRRLYHTRRHLRNKLLPRHIHLLKHICRYMPW
ncbi:MAG: hypothetical protein LE180_02985 [Endomicrobium sp.]|uniref:hypothetical protein n=1 Tax=Candidatus Endomicrobiellum pyrsonymphae TaxID=1408203 RepID=UPI00357C0063|nr:hypothetical protein [Endomicrobium sp.]